MLAGKQARPLIPPRSGSARTRPARPHSLRLTATSGRQEPRLGPSSLPHPLNTHTHTIPTPQTAYKIASDGYKMALKNGDAHAADFFTNLSRCYVRCVICIKLSTLRVGVCANLSACTCVLHHLCGVFAAITGQVWLLHAHCLQPTIVAATTTANASTATHRHRPPTHACAPHPQAVSQADAQVHTTSIP